MSKRPVVEVSNDEELNVGGQESPNPYFYLKKRHIFNKITGELKIGGKRMEPVPIFSISFMTHVYYNTIFNEQFE